LTVCLFVCFLAGLCENNSANFHKIRATEDANRFWW